MCASQPSASARGELGLEFVAPVFDDTDLLHGAARFEVQNLGDLRMTERGENSSFSFEPRKTVGIGDDGRRKHLDRDIARQLGESQVSESRL